MIMACVREIENQQEELKDSPAFWVGEQLKDIVKSNAKCAEIVLTDLKIGGMGIADCEKKIAERAKANKKGSMGFVSPNEAHEIICKFYGIEAAQPTEQSGAISNEHEGGTTASVKKEEEKEKSISIFDFM